MTCAGHFRDCTACQVGCTDLARALLRLLDHPERHGGLTAQHLARGSGRPVYEVREALNDLARDGLTLQIGIYLWRR